MAKALELAENWKKRPLPLACIEFKACVARVGLYGGMPPVKILKSGPLRVHFQHSGAEIRVFERKIDIISSGREGGGGE